MTELPLACLRPSLLALLPGTQKTWSFTKRCCLGICTGRWKRGPGIRSSCRMRCAAEIRPDLYNAWPLRVRKILAWLRENPCAEISLAKPPPRCGAPALAGAPAAGTSTGGKQGWGEGSGEGVCSERTAFPAHPHLFLWVLGKIC